MAGTPAALKPSRKYVAITTSDTVNIALTRAIYVGTTGNIVAVDEDGNTITFTSVPGGTVLPIVVKRINATNTTAANMVALY